MAHLTLTRATPEQAQAEYGFGCVLRSDGSTVRMSYRMSAVLPTQAELTIAIQHLTGGEVERAPGDWPENHEGSRLDKMILMSL